jgi:transposase
MRMFKLAKTSAIKARTQAINQLKAVLVTTDPALRESLSGLSRWMLIRRCAELDTVDPQDAVAAAIYTLRLLSQRILRLGEEIRDLEQRITTAINACAPALLQRRGIGHDSAAALLLAAEDNPERLDTQTSLAALCGTSPIEASSGKTQRRRLNRGGDRQANAALYRIVLTRLRCDPSTQEYLLRRLAEGKTRREVIRCLKRYVAREVYPLLRQVWTTREQHALTT